MQKVKFKRQIVRRIGLVPCEGEGKKMKKNQVFPAPEALIEIEYIFKHCPQSQQSNQSQLE
jgi:hypothetical protein